MADGLPRRAKLDGASDRRMRCTERAGSGSTPAAQEATGYEADDPAEPFRAAPGARGRAPFSPGGRPSPSAGRSGCTRVSAQVSPTCFTSSATDCARWEYQGEGADAGAMGTSSHSRTTLANSGQATTSSALIAHVRCRYRRTIEESCTANPAFKNRAGNNCRS